MIVFYIIISVVISWVTYHCIKNPKVNPTKASTFVSLIAITIIFGLKQFMEFDYIFYSLLIFGASFVGMCSSKKFNDLSVIIGGVLFALVFFYLSPQISHIGGALGFSAFISINASRLINKIISLNR